jgi:predicted dehydrogenase
MSSYHLKAAVVGTGFIGPVHIEALRRLGVLVVGVMGSTPEKSKQAKERFHLIKSYNNYEEMLEDKDADVVHITTPNVHHFEMASQALHAGKHVMCEKPLGMNPQETQALAELAASKPLAAGVCYNVRFYPINLDLRNRIQNNEMGEIFHINGSYVQDWLFHPTDYNWRVLSEHGGKLRTVADTGTHWMDLITSVTGLKITAVFADIKTFHPTRQRPLGEVDTFSGESQTQMETEEIEIDTEDYGSLLFRFDNGALGTLYVSQITAGRKNCIRYEITGSKCTAAWNSEAPNDLWLGHRDQPNESIIRDPALLSESARRYTDYPGGHNEGYPDTFKQLFRAFYDYIAAEDFSAQPGFPTFADGHHEVTICDAIVESVEKQTWINL